MKESSENLQPRDYITLGTLVASQFIPTKSYLNLLTYLHWPCHAHHLAEPHTWHVRHYGAENQVSGNLMNGARYLAKALGMVA